MVLRARSFLALPAAAGALLGASPAAADAGAAVVRHVVSVSAANALIAEARVSLDRAAQVYVEYDNAQAGRYRTALSEPGAEHVIPIVRLRPETTYDYTIFVAGGPVAGGRDAPAPPGGSFTTGRLPPALAMPVQVTGRSSQPLILSDYRRGDDLAYLVFWDETGSVVWYHHEPPPFRPSAVDRLPGGNFFFRDRRFLTELTPLGQVVNRFERGGQWGIPHHDVTVLGDGRVIYPSREVHVFDDSVNGGSARASFLVDNLRVWDPAGGRVEQVWDAKEAWDVTDPDQRAPAPEHGGGRFSWTHVNSVSVGPRGNVILSSRGRHQVVSLSSDFRAIEWQLSGPDSDYEFPNPGDRFYGPHTASQLANGNVLVFDNGWNRPEAEGGRYSRALELRLDDAAGAAVKVWEYRLTPDVYAPTGGSAYRLAGGNTLINFSERDHADPPLIVVEVDAAGNEVFRFENLAWFETAPRFPARYRAYGGSAAVMGETMLRPPAAAHAPAHAETVAGGFTVAVDPARFRELEAAVDGAERIAAGGPFDLYLADGRLVYAREPCADADVAERFFLHVFRDGAGGFDNLDFRFVEHGLRRRGACLAAVALPDYAVSRIRTGQFVSGRDALWSVEFPAGE